MAYQRPPEPRILFTPSGYKDLLEEKKRLLAERPEAVEQLSKGRDMGDLSENGYYKAAKARVSFLDGRIKRIDRLVKLAKIVTPVGNDRVQIGSRVCVVTNGKEFEYTIVGGYESDPLQKTISHLSPIGKSLMGKIVGEKVLIVVPKGTVQYTIKHIS